MSETRLHLIGSTAALALAMVALLLAREARTRSPAGGARWPTG